jgi:hypothetical protein
MSDLEDIQKLIRLKRFERPPADHVDDFLSEFHRRQRAELLNTTARGLLFERVSTYLGDFEGRRWVAAAAGVYALVMFGMYFRGGDAPVGGVEGVTSSEVPETQLWAGHVELSEVDGSPSIRLEPVYSPQGARVGGVRTGGYEALPVGGGVELTPEVPESPQREF